MHSCQFDIEVISASLVDQDVVCAEWFGVSAEIEGDWVIAGGDAEEGGPQEDHDEPATETDDMHAFSG